ncbi:MAG: diguanylate cyclase response regulator [Deltaproteobacteria bacterium]|nr:MAG: diguanylate cyclase response regulator [Deltaproteobacteria bacterium]
MDTYILIVDDDVAVCNAIYKYINTFNYRTSMSFSAEEAVEVLKTDPAHVVITDIMLPEMDGLELTGLIKENYDADVIVMTGHSADYSYEEAIDKGASDFIFKPVRFEELLLRLKRVLKEQELTKERNRMLKELQELAITDDLTKLYNSRHFYTQLESEVDRSVRYSRPLSLLFMDIDCFKKYNDNYGHLEGNEMLIRFARIINSRLRKTDSTYRYGGDEFTIILPETTGKDAEFAARRIRTAMESEIFSPETGKSVTVTISTGITEYCPREDLSTFIRRADQAMFNSKQKGRNQITILQP